MNRLSIDHIDAASRNQTTELDMADPVAHIVIPAIATDTTLRRLLGRIVSLEPRATHRVQVWVVGEPHQLAVVTDGVPGLDLHLVTVPFSSGLGPLLTMGLQAAIEVANPVDVIVVADARDTESLEPLDPMVSGIDHGADIVIGSRFADGGNDTTAPGMRKLLSQKAGQVLQRLTSLRGVQDMTSGFRAYRPSLLAQAMADHSQPLLVEPGFACMVELLVKLARYEPTITEVPMVLRASAKADLTPRSLLTTIRQYAGLGLHTVTHPELIKTPKPRIVRIDRTHW